MRALPLLLLAATLALPTAASAERFAAGVALGSTQIERQAEAGLDASSTTGLWFRYNAHPRIAIEVGLGKIATESGSASIRTFSLEGRAAPVAWRDGTLRPIIMLAVAHDSSDWSGWDRTELGLGLEFDLSRQFLIGADLRAGDRSWDESTGIDDTPVARLPVDLEEGSYRSSRLYLGMRF